MPKFMRLFLVISLTGVVVTTALLTLLYRQVTIAATDNLAQASGLASARAALLQLRPEIEQYLRIAPGTGLPEPAAQRLAAQIAKVVQESGLDNPGPVVRINVFNRMGVVVFSTDRDQLGRNQVDNAGFRSAINGQVVNNLIYRDIFNRFETGVGSGHLAPNMMETYLPVRASEKGLVDGVFESYTDVSPLVHRNQNATLIVLSGVALMLMLLCGALVLVTQRALRAIESQQARAELLGLHAIQSEQHSISERTAALEMLSAKMLSNDEAEKKKLALGLHQGLAQSLTTIKTRVAHYLTQFAPGEPVDASLASTVALLQSAIDEVQTIASALRPTSLDELGLLPTIDDFCSEFQRRHAPIMVTADISVAEHDVPAPLKIVIYRIIESAFADIARYESIDEIGLALRYENSALTLAIDDTSRDSRYAAAAGHGGVSDLHLRFGEAQQRATLSGGLFTIARNEAGGVTLRASWMV